MCDLLALVPHLVVDKETWQSFIQQAITTLFQISLKSDEPQVACTALRALSQFSHDDFNLKCLPQICKADLKIPSKYLTAKVETPLQIEDVFDYVPGICWTTLIDIYPNDILESGLFRVISKLINDEVNNMPMWIYRKAALDVTKKNEPPNYNRFFLSFILNSFVSVINNFVLFYISCLKEDSVLAALVQYLLRICEMNPDITFRIKGILTIMNGPFERPLPPLDWTILEPVVLQHVSIRSTFIRMCPINVIFQNLMEQFLEVVLKQVPHSYSAQTIAQNFLIEPLQMPLAQVVILHLGPISQTFKLELIEDFISRVFTENQLNWTTVLQRLATALKSDHIRPDVRKMVASYVIPLLPILPDDRFFVEQYSICYSLLDDDSFPSEPSNEVAEKYIVVLCLASQFSTKLTVNYLQQALQMTFFLKT